MGISYEADPDHVKRPNFFKANFELVRETLKRKVLVFGTKDMKVNYVWGKFTD